MIETGPSGPVNWDDIRFVVFDVDGTLYPQRPLRIRMARDMVHYAVRTRSLKHIRVLSAYRRLREVLGDQETSGFDAVLIERTAQATATPPDAVRALVADWIDQRPVRHLKSARYPGVLELFAAIRARGKMIGILSDYPAAAKLAAMELDADYVAYAGDPAIDILKPHPKGLLSLIEAAGVQPEETILIGDRASRDGMAARRAGAHALLLSRKPIAGWNSFTRFEDPVFAPLLRP